MGAEQSHLNRIGMDNRIVLDLTLEQQAKYCDHVTKSVVDNNQNLDSIGLRTGNDEEMYEDWNVCAVGNIAYIALYAKKEEDREYAKNLLDNYIKYAKEHNLNPMVNLNSW